MNIEMTKLLFIIIFSLILLLTTIYDNSNLDVSKNSNSINNYISNNLADSQNIPSYILCKRPLSINIFNIDKPILEKYSSNMVHFHFFNINNNNINSPFFKISFINDKIGEKVNIDSSCIKNNFSNFGYFQNSTVRCDENIENYTYCSKKLYNKYIIQNSLTDLMNDFNANEYKIYSYNCQVFAKNIIDIYSLQENSFISPLINIHQGRCYDIHYQTMKDLFNFNQSTNVNYCWEKNPLYKKIHHKLWK